MRHGKTARWLLVFGATCSLASLGSAQVTELDEVDRRQTMQIGLLVERVELDAAVAGRLLMEHPDLGDSGKLRAAAQRAIADGHGEIAESCYLLTRSGNRAKLESILEFHYPSKWLPARLPEKITGPVAAGTAPGVPATPSHFVNRPLGSTAELDMVVQAGGRTAKHGLATETIRLAGEESFGRGLSKVTTPLLDVQKWSTEMRSRIGTTTLVAAQHIDREPTAGGRTALVFATTKHQIPEATPEERARIEKLFEEHGPHEAAALLKNPFATPPGNDPFNTSAPAQGYPPDQPKWIMLMTGLEAIEIDRERFAELLGTLGKYADSTPLRDALEADLDRGTAKMIASATVPSRSGQRANIRSSKEHLYPTDAHPPEIPEELVAPPAGDRSKYTTPVLGRHWEMQAEGTSLTIDAVVGADGRMIEMNIAPTISWLAREISYGKDEAEVTQPLFAKLQLMSNVSVNADDDLLIAAVTPRQAETGAPQSDRRVLLFLHTSIIHGPTPEESSR